MSQRFSVTAPALTALALAFGPAAHADLISWGPVQTVTNTSNVRTGGTLVTAKCPWAQTFANPTVAGVTFDAYAPIGWGGGGWTLLAGSSTGDVEYDALLDSARVVSQGPNSNPTEWGGIRLDTLGTLEIGRQYEIQIWYSDQRTGTPTNILFDRRMTMSSAVGDAILDQGAVTNLGSLNQGANSGQLDADPNNMAGPTDTAMGSYVVGTFTRTTGDQLWLLVQGTHPVASNVLKPHINAFQIRDLTGSQIGSNYCPGNANSTGSPATISASGSALASANNVTLMASGVPAGQFGIFVVADATDNVAVGSGILCLGGGNIGRYQEASQIRQADANGDFSLAIDLTSIPTPTMFVMATPGDTFYFQAWYRDFDMAGGNTSNFSGGLQIDFQ